MKKILFPILGLMIALLPLSAQNAVKASEPTPQQREQEQMMKPVPQDPEVRVGHLPNGLTYYIRHNENPKNRCDFQIAQGVGAILEEDSQNGLAHFLEHMAFQGTKNFPGKMIINYFESIGVNFGGNINAYTALDQTVYRLSDVPTNKGPMDSALLVLHDWSCALSLEGSEIDAERGVIREEWRQGRDASRRMYKEMNALAYPGSQYAKRDVIGDTAVINNFTYEDIRKYYHKWYGPDLQGIIIVGDIDVDAMEVKVKELFSPIPPRENRGVRPIYEIADNVDPIIAITSDKELSSSSVRVDFKVNPLPTEVKNSTQGQMFDLVNYLVMFMNYYRFEAVAHQPNANFLQAGEQYGSLVKSKDAVIFYATPKVGMTLPAFKDLMVQIEKIRRYGYTEAELSRAKVELLSYLENNYKERNNQRNQAVAEGYVQNFLDKTIPVDPTWEMEQVRALMPELTVAAINPLVNHMITDRNVIVRIMEPQKEGIVMPTKLQVLDIMHKVKASEIERPKTETKAVKLFETTPKPGKIKSIKENKSLGTTEIVLSNGIKVVVKPTDFMDDEINMQAWSWGGTSKVKSPKDLRAVSMADQVVEHNGIGHLNALELQRALSGKSVQVTPSINTFTEGLSGYSTQADFETMLQLMNLYFTSPRTDKGAFTQLMDQYHTALANRGSNPMSSFQDSISEILSSYSPRTILTNEAMVDDVDQAASIAFYKERFANPADFTISLVGNIDPTDKATQELLATWLGSLKTKKAFWHKEKMTDDGVRRPQGKSAHNFTRDMSTEQTSNFIVIHAQMPYTMQNRVSMKVIASILSTRYLESIREKEGGSYGVGVFGMMNQVPINQASLMIQFNTDPKKEAKLMGIIYQEIQTIINDGPLAEDFSKSIKIMLKQETEDLRTNDYWNTIVKNYYRDGDNMLDYKTAVEQCTPEMIQSTLKALYEAGNITEVSMSPEK